MLGTKTECSSVRMTTGHERSLERVGGIVRRGIIRQKVVGRATSPR